MRYYLLLITISIGCLQFSGCENSDFELGQNLLESRGRTILIDTCSVTLTTLLIDSLTTSATSGILVGSVNSADRGSFSSMSFLTFNLPVYSETRTNMNNPLVFDSITFNLSHSKYFIGDTLTNFKLSIHRLTETLKLNDGYLYNNSTFSFDETPLAQYSFRPYPNLKKELSLKLPNEFGIDLLNKLSTSHESVTNYERFAEYFKGFVLKATDATNAAIFSFSLNSGSGSINLYYHYVEEKKEEKSIVIEGISSSSFNSISHNRENSPLEELKNGYNGLPSSRSNNQSYIMGLTGLYTRIELPYLRNLLELGDAGTIQSAQLLLYPVKHSYNQFPLPDTLSLYIADHTNTTVDAITTSYGETLQTGNLVVDKLYDNNTYYSFTITDFVKEELRAIGVNKRKLILTLPDNNMKKTFQSVLLGDQKSDNQQVKLKITYNVYDRK